MLSGSAAQVRNEEAVQMDSIKTQSRRGGTMDHKIHNDKIVSAEFRGDEKRLILIQANGPVVLTGGGRSGCAPTGYFLNDSDINQHYLSVSFMR